MKKKFLKSAFILSLLISNNFIHAEQDSNSCKDKKGLWDTTKDATKNVYESAKDASKDVYESAKDVTVETTTSLYDKIKSKLANFNKVTRKDLEELLHDYKTTFLKEEDKTYELKPIYECYSQIAQDRSTRSYKILVEKFDKYEDSRVRSEQLKKELENRAENERLLQEELKKELDNLDHVYKEELERAIRTADRLKEKSKATKENLLRLAQQEATAIKRSVK